jgi:hypothetical protein
MGDARGGAQSAPDHCAARASTPKQISLAQLRLFVSHARSVTKLRTCRTTNANVIADALI